MTRLRKCLLLAPRLAALLATSYLLIASGYVPPEECGPGIAGCGGGGNGGQAQLCEHASESIAFHVSGTCGPDGDIVVSSAAGECTVTVQGAGAVGLPSAGRFEEHADPRVSLTQDAWTLSAYPPETALPAQPDAGVFTVVRDAQANTDLGGFSVNPGSGGAVGSHATPTLRTCTARPKDSRSLTLTCTGGGLADCAATLVQI